MTEPKDRWKEESRESGCTFSPMLRQIKKPLLSPSHSPQSRLSELPAETNPRWTRPAGHTASTDLNTENRTHNQHYRKLQLQRQISSTVLQFEKTSTIQTVFRSVDHGFDPQGSENMYSLSRLQCKPFWIMVSI